MVNCPVCDAGLDLDEDELDEADEFSCEECGASLTVVGKHPLELEETSEEEKDDDDDEDDDLDDDEEDEEEDEDDWK
ncbi:MAG: hypothetical protein ACRD7E_24920 [Bryobacteraceae bacterium]